jgi:hypothetical protein
MDVSAPTQHNHIDVIERRRMPSHRCLALALALSVLAACSKHEASACDDGAPAPSSALREDENLELLALSLSDGLTADEAIYQRLTRDVSEIRRADPLMNAVKYSPLHDGRSLLIAFDATTRESVSRGDYHAWDCLNKQYGAAVVDSSARSAVRIQLSGRFDLDTIARAYTELPGVKIAEPVRTTVLDQSFTLCVTPETDTWHYVFSDDNRRLHYFISSRDGAVENGGSWSSGTSARPVWAEKYWNENSCR